MSDSECIEIGQPGTSICTHPRCKIGKLGYHTTCVIDEEPQSQKCSRGEHEATGSKVSLQLVEYGHICKHCRSLYVEK